MFMLDPKNKLPPVQPPRCLGCDIPMWGPEMIMVPGLFTTPEIHLGCLQRAKKKAKKLGIEIRSVSTGGLM